ncbi:hypothetical protein BDR26DRAFT_225004 [Obelidium mucronatum]|nr:hypothetical protein BDR26DRAFT_225004 [Obelidium mucronatum]
MTNRLRDCLRCRRQRVPCDQQKPACQLCVALHVFDECHYPEDNSVSNQLSPHLVDYALTSRTDVLTQVMAASETPLLDDMLPNNDWSIQDPELIPTTNDWILVYSFFTANERSGQIRMSIDVRNFINNFYHEPPALRLTLCAIAAHYSKSPLPESVSLSYYQRARKALFRAADHPSVKTAQAFYWIFCFAYWKGQPEIGRPFFKAALGMILGLKLNIDPDDSSWLLPLNLTASEKEERRRLFWGCYYILKEYVWRNASNPYFYLKGETSRSCY